MVEHVLRHFPKFGCVSKIGGGGDGLTSGALCIFFNNQHGPKFKITISKWSHDFLKHLLELYENGAPQTDVLKYSWISLCKRTP